MLYNLSTDIDRQRFRLKCQALIQKACMVELTEKARRTRPQNSYLHLLIGVVAMETGNTLQYAKEVYFKRLANAALFVRTKEDKLAGKVEVLRSSAELSKEEMTTAIDRFKRWAAENGIFLPDPGDEWLLQQIEYEMAKSKMYL